MPVGDARNMADAIIAAMDDQSHLDGRKRAADFTPSKITRAYLNTLLPQSNQSVDTLGQYE